MKPEMLKPKQTFFDKIKEFNNPEEGTAAKDVKDQTDVAYYSYIDNLLGGIPGKIAKSVNTDAYNKYQDARNKYKGIAAQGDIAAAFTPTAAGNLINAGLIGKTAIKAGKLSGVANKIGTGLKSGAILGLEQAAPRLATGQMNAKDAIGNVGVSAGIGGLASGLGKGAEYLGRRLGIKNKGESFVKPFQEGLIDKELASLTGLTSRDMLKASNSTARLYGVDKVGNAVNNAEQMKKSVLDLVKKNDILNPDEAQQFIQGTGKRFQNLENAFEKSGAKPVDVVYGMAENADVLNYLDKNGDSGKDLLGGMFNRIKDAKSIASAKKILNNYISAANKTDDIAKDELGDIAHIIRENLDDMVLQFDPNYTDMKADWKALQPLRYMVARDKTAMTRASGGSPTAEKQAIMKLIGGTTGGTAALNMSGFDKDDPSTWGGAAASVAGGAAAGSMLNRAIPAVKNMVTGGVAGALNRPGVLNTLEKAGAVAPELINKGIQAGQRFLSGRLSDPEEARAEQTAPVQDEYTPPNKEELLAEAPVKPAINEKLMAKIDKKLMQIYAEKYSDVISWEDFRAKAEKLTDGFEPVKAGKILFTDPKQRAKFTRDYKAAQKIKGYSKAYESGQFGASILDAFDGTAKQKAFDQKEIADTIGSLLAKEGELPTAEERKQIALDLKTIGALKVSPEEKQNILLQKLQDFYGLDVESLRVLGLV